jgi:hypothetical protein
MGEQVAGLGPAGVSVGAGRRQGRCRLVADRPAVLVGFALESRHRFRGPLTQQSGPALGLIQSPLAALEGRLRRQVRLGDDSLGVGQGVITCRDGVLFGGFENGARLGRSRSASAVPSAIAVRTRRATRK